MPGDNPNTDDVTTNPIYQAILEKLKEQDSKIDIAVKKIDDVTGFNKQLLSRSPSGITNDADVAIKKLENYLNEN